MSNIIANLLNKGDVIYLVKDWWLGNIKYSKGHKFYITDVSPAVSSLAIKVYDMVDTAGNNCTIDDLDLKNLFTNIPPEEEDKFKEQVDEAIERAFLASHPTVDNASHFKNITDEMLETYKVKNKNYGNSFNNSIDEFGLIAAVVRLSDKFQRLVTLVKNKTNGTKDESILDTLTDAANYCIMTRMYIENHKDIKNTVTKQ